MDLNVAKKWIEEAKSVGIANVALSGGETLCYPHLYEVISYAHSLSMTVSAAFSGWGITPEVLEKLRQSGLQHLCISLNGSTKEINELTRDGYEYAISALSLLKENKLGFNTILNWVMHSNNTSDFPNIVMLAEANNIHVIDIIGFKPDSQAQMDSVPSREQMEWIANIVKNQKGETKIAIESCYSPLLTLACDTKLFGNLNRGNRRGCRAGINLLSVNIDGSLSPCRHIQHREFYDTIEDYWNNSEVLKKIRQCDELTAEEPCLSCRFLNHCKPCLAINTEIHKRIFRGYPNCPIAQK